MNITVDNEFQNLIEPLSAEEYAQLEANIVTEGCRDALVVWQNTLLDGHNRYQICTERGIDFAIVSLELDSREAAINWIIDNQLGRRNLTPEQRLHLIGKRYNNEKKEIANASGVNQYDKKVVGAQFEPQPKTAAKIAQQYNVSRETVKRAGKYAEAVDNIAEIAPAAKAEILQGKSELTQAEVSAFSGATEDKAQRIKRQLEELIEQGVEERKAFTQVAKQVAKEDKADKKAKREADIQAQREAIAAGKAELPKGVFEVIAIDPPWNYGRDYDPDGSRVASPYPELSQEKLLELKIPAAKDCVMFLWTTQKFIWNAKELLDKWGFEYKAIIVWDKSRMLNGFWLRMQCEFCLVGIKGKPTWYNTTHRDIIIEQSEEHSRKPAAFYNLVNDITVGRKLDYFAREQREGWATYGNDTEKFGVSK